MSASPKSILRSDPTRVVITWQDGTTSVWTAAELRREFHGSEQRLHGASELR